MRTPISSCLAILLIALGCGLAKSAEPAPLAPVGIATIDITPETPVRMYGYASRKTESEGVAARLSASALAIGGDGNAALLLSVENGSVPPAIRTEVLRRLQARLPLKPEQFMLCNTHIHSGPDLEGMNSLTGQERQHMAQYAELLTTRLTKIALEAVASRRPAHLSWAQGTVGFATNRRVLKDGKWSGFGAVPSAPADHTLPVLRITDADGKLLGILINYACHNTTLRPNFKQIHGDWGGCAREAIQADFPGTIALIALGCGADSDPAPHDTFELCQRHGRAVADEVKRLMNGPWKPITPAVTARSVALEIPFDPPPSIDDLKKFAEKTYSAAQTLKLLQAGQKPPTSERYEITTWTFGDDLTMVFLPNEVVVDYALRLRRELGPTPLWINAYSNEVLYYVASKRLIREGGYEVNNSLSALVTYGRVEHEPNVEDRIIEAVRSIVPGRLAFINSGVENASPLQWDIAADGTVNIHLLYDYERNSPNRAAGHWHFQLQGRPGSDLTLLLHSFDNVYNGRIGVPVSKNSICYISPDGQHWRVIPTEFLEGNRLRIRVHLEGESLYLARLEPYRISDLDRLLAEIRTHPMVQITPIGKTVEGRPLEIVRIGNPAAPVRVLLRARAHPWEPSGNWIVQGLIRSLLADDDLSRQCLQRYCVYILPMANKDGVARGLTRFNTQGVDLNRNWDKPADQKLAPENYALEMWLNIMAKQGQSPHLAIDLHNDESGRLHISRPPIKNLDQHLQRMRLLERLLRQHTWFTEGSTGETVRNPGTFGEGLLERYGIDACILEFNCNWIAGLKQPPSAQAWEQFGSTLRRVFLDYFTEIGAGQQQ